MFTVVSYWKDFYGCTASIKHNDNGADLTIRTPSGELIHKKHYATLKGAKIAMGKSSDEWHFIKQTSSGKIQITL